MNRLPRSSSTPATSAVLPVSSQFVVEGDFDPQLPVRVLGRIAQVNDLPRRFGFERVGEDALRVTMELDAVEPDEARELAQRLLSIATVRSVDLMFVSVRERRAA